ncbi:hypothetical protein [Hymenobacter jeollabukensis]|uniref:DUF4133 domain-containing protein n=1 Tax=Hymenobacter jeollabukensis TaxID=2025313 RepID=A0A5R8WIU8_9BACT|nr:hypothetical protein [Hymenobacter jeollabukensis]TLM88796.1 hypothetical protein FDY95_23465 [Hymenobacter jeollabukensis]
MQTYKSIERPAQVLGLAIQDLGLVFGLLIVGGLLTGVLGLVISIPAWVYLVLLLTSLGLFFGLKYLAKHKPPGFLMGYVSFNLQQPRRLTLGAIPTPHEKSKKRSADRS